MNCQNLNLQKLIEKTEKVDELEKELERLKQAMQRRTDYLISFLKEKGLLEIAEKDNHKYDFIDANLTTILSQLFDAEYQAAQLANERMKNDAIFKDQMFEWNAVMQKKENDLVNAWEKFRGFANKYRKTLEEINNENI